MFWLARLLFYAVLAALPLNSVLAQSETPSFSFSFKEPRLKKYRVKPRSGTFKAASVQPWLEAVPEDDPADSVQFGHRIVLQLQDPARLEEILSNSPGQLSRKLTESVFILELGDALAALREADRLAQIPGVVASAPITKRKLRSRGIYASLPNDPYFGDQWNFENKNSAGASEGADLNMRAAWPLSLGEGVLVAIGDDGIDLGHPELSAQALNSPHYNFVNSTESGEPFEIASNHGTAVAGLAVAAGNNRRGIIGAAPNAKLASWVILSMIDDVSNEALMDMYQYRSNVVAVQNHSWGLRSRKQSPLSLPEDIGISNAVHFGRSGKGVVIVRACGNEKGEGQNANDEAEISDPRVIAVAAVRKDGKAASYSDRGSSILVAAPSADDEPQPHTIATTDRRGADGFNSAVMDDDSADYGFGDTGFSGTSAAAPQIAGVVALMLSANPNLSYRDAQQILALSARHFDLTDVTLATNSAGFRVSDNTGFGVPDAGEAVRIAKGWKPRPAPVKVHLFDAVHNAVPEISLVQIEGAALAANLQQPRSTASLGPETGQSSATLPLVAIGLGDSTVTTDLRGKAALIQRGDIFFWEKINNAARLGAAFAIIYNNKDATQLITMALTDFTHIPAVFIGQNDGETLADLLVGGANLKARLTYNADDQAARHTFNVTDTLICEHAGVRIHASHPRRGDLRIVLISPGGTRSLLQFTNLDDMAGPAGWAYYSTHHFFESTAGTWTVLIVDQQTGSNGFTSQVELLLSGVQINDDDKDGLDDGWETQFFPNKNQGPKDDPDQDGYSNAREQLMGTSPTSVDIPFEVDIVPWNQELARLSWPSQTNHVYEIWSGAEAGKNLTLQSTLTGKFPETEFYVPLKTLAQEFFQVRRN